MVSASDSESRGSGFESELRSWCLQFLLRELIVRACAKNSSEYVCTRGNARSLSSFLSFLLLFYFFYGWKKRQPSKYLRRTLPTQWFCERIRTVLRRPPAGILGKWFQVIRIVASEAKELIGSPWQRSPGPIPMTRIFLHTHSNIRHLRNASPRRCRVSRWLKFIWRKKCYQIGQCKSWSPGREN